MHSFTVRRFPPKHASWLSVTSKRANEAKWCHTERRCSSLGAVCKQLVTISPFRSHVRWSFIENVYAAAAVAADGRAGGCKLLAVWLCVAAAVVGCAELRATSDMRLNRLGDGDVELACRSTDQKWRLTCVDNHWHGIVGNCTIRQ